MATVFLSHSKHDKTFVRELYHRLTRDGVDCFFDEKSIDWGDNFVISIEQAIDRCDFYVAVLSPAFVESNWAQAERASALAQNPQGPNRKMLPLLLRKCQIPGFLMSIQTIDVSTSDKFEANYPRICESLGGRLRPDPLPPSNRRALPPPTPLRCPHYMPFRSLGDQFVGRIEALWTVYAQLSQNHTSIVEGIGVVYGAGGLGKTQLAVEYVHRFNLYYPGGVFWIEADQGLSRFITILSKWAGIEVDGRLPEREQLDTIRAVLASRRPTLLVLDNFPETGPLSPWLPTSGNIHVLVTTRRRDLVGHSRLSLPFLTATEGQLLLKRFEDDARELVEDVGGLPLALDIIRAYLDASPGTGPADLRREMQRLGTVLVLERFAAEYTQELPTIHERSITATFQVSWNQALDDAKEILRVMSQLAPAPVPLRLLRGVLEWPDSCSLDDRLLVGIRNLLRLSLVECDPQGQPTAHRLILGFVRQFGGADSRWAKTIDGVEREMDRAYSDSDVASSAEVDSVAPHAEIVLGRPDIPPEQGAAIAADLWRHYTTVGRYLAAAHNANTAATFAARCDPKMRDRRSNVATALDGWAELKEALDILRRARDSKKLRHLANMFMKPAESLGLRELDEARDLLRQVLVSAGLKYPISHPFNKFRLLNVKKVLNELPEFNDLLALLQRALESTKRRYAPGHPFIATSQYNLGLALGIRGELARARDLVQEALEAGERLNQSDQPLIAIQQGVLATLLKGLGEYAEARILAQKALQSTLCQFGPEHPETRHVKCLLKSLDDRKG